MIRLTRGPLPPILSKRGQIETDALWHAWTNGTPIKPKASLYAHHQIKSALKAQQHDKCAYCETKNPRSHDVVEHYRPKLGYRQNTGQKLKQPHYFWLSYEWGNLIFSCDICNDQSHKENLFPLEKGSKRATPNKPSIKKEKALIINPYQEDPSKHIKWKRDIPVARTSTSKGALNIRVFGLDKDTTLLDARRGHYNLIAAALETAESLPINDPKRDRTRSVLLKSTSYSEQYAAMVRANFLTRINKL